MLGYVNDWILQRFACALPFSLSGHDMNRCWADPDSIQHAPIAKLKELLAQGQAGQGVELFCDVHGHVRWVL
jgi:hypothetical protein